MNWPFKALISLQLLLFVNTRRIIHNNNNNKLTFQRNNVEKLPDNKINNINSLNYGTTYLPLRTSVESYPGFMTNSLAPSFRDTIDYIINE